MGLTHSDVAERWVGNVLYGNSRTARNHNMFAEGDILYSYGRHFELARAMRDRKGEVVAFLVNGDTYSPTTSKHQSATRSALSGHPHVIMPYAVLSSAGIERDTVRIVDVSPDTVVRNSRTYYEMQPRWSWADVPEYDHRPPTDEEMATRLAAYNAKRHQEWLDHQRYAWEAMNEGKLFDHWLSNWRQQGKVFPPTPATLLDLRAEANTPDWSRSYTARQVFAQVQYVTEVNRRLFTNHHHNSWSEVDVEYVGGEPLSYTVTTERHVLGEAVIEGTVTWSRRRRCQDCGQTGTRPRVGHDWDWRCSRCRGNGWWLQPQSRTSRYLSGFDHNEPNLSYFFCELPTRTATTVKEAYAELKPDTVKIAEQMEREVYRQGDIFAIEMPDLVKRDLTKMGARVEKMGELLGTNHAASEVAYLPDGRTLARGILRHRPDGRRPDHVMCRLTKGTWHLVVKNTVPVSA